MDHLNAQVAFSVNKELVVLEQATVDSDLVKEAYAQTGLLLLSAEAEGDRFRRTVREYVLAIEALAAVQGRISVDRDGLRKFHEEAVAERRVPMNPGEGLEIESDLANSNAAIPSGISIPPYHLSNDPIPIPAFVLYWPTITPVFPEKRMEPGDQWKGSIAVEVGSSEFMLSYSVKLVEYVQDDPLIEVALEDQEPVAVVGKVALHLSPRGSWKVQISHLDGIWLWGKGRMAFGVRAKFKEDEEDEEEIDVEVLRWENEFTLERVPVSFDETRIFAAAWQPGSGSATPRESAPGAGEGPA